MLKYNICELRRRMYFDDMDMTSLKREGGELRICFLNLLLTVLLQSVIVGDHGLKNSTLRLTEGSYNLFYFQCC